MHHPRLIPLAAGAALLVPAAADAATLAPLKPCYRSVDRTTRETVPVEGYGFTPGSKVLVTVRGSDPTTATAFEDGKIIGSVKAPYRARGERPFTVTAAEEGRPSNTVSAGSRVAALSVRLKPSRARPSRYVRFLGRGFTDGPWIYGHYLRAGKVRKTVSLGRPQGPCGRLDALHRQIPLRKPATGRWTLQVDNQPEYAAQPTSVFVQLFITVKRVLRRP